MSADGIIHVGLARPINVRSGLSPGFGSATSKLALSFDRTSSSYLSRCVSGHCPVEIATDGAFYGERKEA